MVDSQVNEIMNVITGQNAMILVIIMIVFTIICVGGGFFAYWIGKRLLYNKKVILFQKINGRFEPIKNFKARILLIGKSGDEILHILKPSKYLPKPTIQVGRNTYWFFEREDGEWINFSTGDFDMDAREVGARFLDKEMRYARTSLQSHIKERYDKGNWFKENFAMIVSVIVIFLLLLFMWLIMGEITKAVGMAGQSSKDWAEISTNLKEILKNIDIIKSGGSGVLPAPQ